MNSSYFVSLESTDQNLTKTILPGGEKYGIESIYAISKNTKFDIDAINLSTDVSDKIKNFEIEHKFNSKFFPTLPSEFIFDDPFIDEFNTKEEQIESLYVLKRSNILIDEEKAGQIAVCKNPNTDQVLDLFKQNDYHFVNQDVSKKIVLN